MQCPRQGLHPPGLRLGVLGSPGLILRAVSPSPGRPSPGMGVRIEDGRFRARLENYGNSYALQAKGEGRIRVDERAESAAGAASA